MTPYRLLVARTVTVTNHIYIDADNENDARARFGHLLENESIVFDDESWGESFYYQVLKPGEAVGHFEILEIEEQ